VITALRTVACAGALAASVGGSALPHQPRETAFAAPRIANAWLYPQGGILFVFVSAGGPSYDVDASKLRAVARPYVAGAAADVPWRDLRVDAGRPVAEPGSVSGSPHEFRIPVTFPEPPGPPGMYTIQMRLESGFARLHDGAEIPQKPSPYGQAVWFPDESGDDRGLQVVQESLRGRAFYGYGGTTVGCEPAWYREYDASTPIPIRSVARERGHAVYLGTGRSNDGFSFLALDPIVAMVDLPDTKFARGWGGSGGIPPEGPCPALRFADPWYLDVRGTPVAQPAGWPQREVHAGMTRAEVRRSYGYPSGYATGAEFDRMDEWTYDHGVRFSWSVTFANDRVAAFTSPANGP
jgi:hypothetical protein